MQMYTKHTNLRQTNNKREFTFIWHCLLMGYFANIFAMNGNFSMQNLGRFP